MSTPLSPTRSIALGPQEDLILVAGNKTTRNPTDNGMLALLRYPTDLQRLRDDPLLVEWAVAGLQRNGPPSPA